jgi:diguanylate cyclase (GGDEF)-like protein
MTPNRTTIQLVRQIEAAWLLRDSQPAEAQLRAERLLEKALAAHDQHSQARVLVVLSYLYCRLQEHELAVQSSFAALRILEHAPVDSWLPRLHNVLALVYGDVGDRTLNREHLQKQIDLSKEIGDLEWEATGYHDLAVYLQDRDLTAAIKTMEQALAMFRQLNVLDGVAYALSNLGDFRAKQQRWQEAYDYSCAALVLARQLQIRYIHILTAASLATYAVKIQRDQEAEQYLAEAFALSKSDEPDWSHDVYRYAGDYAYARQEYNQALIYYQKALALYQEINGSPGVNICHKQISLCYEALGDAARALAHYKQYGVLKEQLVNQEVELKIRTLEVIYKTRTAQREADIERAKNSELERYIAELESLQRQLREQNLHDALTNIHNRRALMEQGVLQVQMAERYHSLLSVAMFDIDHFKRINDTCSHKVGDQVLVQVAMIARNLIRQIDFVARFGGEEFVLLLPETNLQQATHACERLRQAVEQFDWHTIHPDIHVTISVGVACMKEQESFEAILYRADILLNEAKRRGRNMVVA